MTSPYRLTDGIWIPARTAALLSKLLDLDRRRVDWRGSDGEVDAVLNAWRQVVVAFTDARLERPGFDPGFVVETEVAGSAQPAAQCDQRLRALERLVSSEVADLLGITEQAVTKAARDGRLVGDKVGDRWVFTPEAVAIYNENRSRHGER